MRSYKWSICESWYVAILLHLEHTIGERYFAFDFAKGSRFNVYYLELEHFLMKILSFRNPFNWKLLMVADILLKEKVTKFRCYNLHGLLGSLVLFALNIFKRYFMWNQMTIGALIIACLSNITLHILELKTLRTCIIPPSFIAIPFIFLF